MVAADELTTEYHVGRQKLAEEILLPQVERNEQRAIRGLLFILAAALADSAPVIPSLSVYLSDVLRLIADGEDPKKAFGLRRNRGEKSDRLRKRQEMFSRAYRVEVQRNKGRTLEEAIEQVAAKLDLSEDTVKGSWKKHHVEAKQEIKQAKEFLGRVIDI